MRIDFVITIVILVWWYLFSISRVFHLSSCESFSLLSRNTASTLILSSFSNIPCHLKDGASCNSVISDRKNIQCRFVPPIFICAQPNVATTDNSRAIMLMYYGRLFIKVACYLLEKKKKIPYETSNSITKKCSIQMFYINPLPAGTGFS